MSTGRQVVFLYVIHAAVIHCIARRSDEEVEVLCCVLGPLVQYGTWNLDLQLKVDLGPGPWDPPPRPGHMGPSLANLVACDAG